MPPNETAPARVSGTGKSADDRVRVRVEQDQQIVTIESPRGISEVILQRLDDHWPAHVIIRLQLRGLEELTIEGGGLVVKGVVSETGATPRLRQWIPPDESVVLTANDPLWLDLKGPPVGLVPPIPGFEWVLPWGFQRANPERIRVAFVDFFR